MRLNLWAVALEQNPVPSNAIICKWAAAVLLCSCSWVTVGCLGSSMAGAENARPAEETSQSLEPRTEISLMASGTDAFILMYHDVLSKRTKDALWYDSTAEEFKRDLDRLTAWGATFVSMREVHLALTQDRPLPPRSVAITFDDNYLGFYQNAWPLLKQRRIPVTMYVHTDFVGGSQGRPKMTWEILQELVRSDLFTVGSHTQSHPEDFSKLSADEQKRELTRSKALIEEKLGVPVTQVSWPNGKYSAASIRLAKEAGYAFAVAMDSGLAWHSSSLFEIKRYNPSKIEKAMRDSELESADPLGSVELAFKPGEIIKEVGKVDNVPLSLVRGGRPESVLVPGRESVADLVKSFNGVAGINGGFFLISDLKSTDNRMIGPALASNVGMWLPDLHPERVSKLVNRPLVLMTKEKMIITPFRAPFNKREVVESEIPEVQDAFVAGAWLVHGGRARTKEQIEEHGAQDAMDPRRRAFIGWDSQGRLAIGACTDSYGSDRFAQALVKRGIQEAVLLDSGFSSSVVFGGEILASGHATSEKPSRPVPHAIIIKEVAASRDGSGTGTEPIR